jgi:hypothetical protein
LGGFVSAIDRQGKKTVYGLTTGHILKSKEFYDANNNVVSDADGDVFSDDDTQEEDSEDDEDYAYNYSEPSSTTESSIGETLDKEMHIDPESHSWTSLGAVSAVSYSDRARDRDWALLDLDAIHNGQLKVPQVGTNEMRRPVRPADSQSAVICNRSKLACTVTSLPARAILPSGRKFIDVNVLHIAGDQGVYCSITLISSDTP